MMMMSDDDDDDEVGFKDKRQEQKHDWDSAPSIYDG